MPSLTTAQKQRNESLENIQRKISKQEQKPNIKQ